MVDIRTFGGFHVRNDGQYFLSSILPCGSKILVFLLLNNGIPQRREKLVDLFFGEVDVDHGLNALSTCIWRLRKWIDTYLRDEPVEIIATRRDVVVSGQDTGFLDISRFESWLSQTTTNQSLVLTPQQRVTMEKALAEYHGPFMDGDGDDWILFERERLHCLFILGLNKMMQSFASEGHVEDALNCGRRILHVDPLREYVHREMMRHYAASGQRAAAIRQFEICRQVLQEECDIAPMTETVLLMKMIRNGTFSPERAEPTQQQAILPFTGTDAHF